MTYGWTDPDSVMGKIAAHYSGGVQSLCGCCSPVVIYINSNLLTNQIASLKCHFGAITTICDTTNCWLAYNEVTYK